MPDGDGPGQRVGRLQYFHPQLRAVRQYLGPLVQGDSDETSSKRAPAIRAERFKIAIIIRLISPRFFNRSPQDPQRLSANLLAIDQCPVTYIQLFTIYRR